MKNLPHKVSRVFYKLQERYQSLIDVGGDKPSVEYSAIDTGYTDEVWDKVIAKVNEYNLDLFSYLYFAVKTLRQNQDQIYPNQLLSDKLLELYTPLQQTYHEAARVQWRVESDNFRMEYEKYDNLPDYAKMTPMQKQAFTLMNTNISFSQLFTFCHALRNGLLGVCKKIEQDAALQYVLFKNVYDEFIQTEKIRETLERLVNEL
jgi:hypothetical protein